MRFLESESFPRLVDDKLGSRIADRCWAIADPYIRVSTNTSHDIDIPSISFIGLGTDR